MLRSQGRKRTGTPGHSPTKHQAAHSLQQSGVRGQNNRKQQQEATRPSNAFQFEETTSHSRPMEEEAVLGDLLEDDVAQNHQSKAMDAASTSATPPQYITVSLDDLEEAGIDIQNVNKLTEPQIQNLLAISEQNRKRLAERQSTTPASNSPTTSGIVSISPQRSNQGQPTGGKSVYKSSPKSLFRDGLQASTSQQHSDQASVYRVPESEVESVVEVENVVEDEMGGEEASLTSNGPPRLTREQARGEQGEDSMQQEDEEEEDLPGPPNGADSQITITITDEGHVKLTDASQQTFFFSRDELSQRNIDAANLTDANIQDIIQMALPSLVMGRPDTEEPSPKKRLLSNSQLSSEHVLRSAHHNGVSSSTMEQAPHSYHTRSIPNLSGISVTPTTSTQAPPSLYFNRREQVSNATAIGGGTDMIGEEVEVRPQGNAGRSEMATVRYFRPGYGYKVQFSDGHFEWITEGNVQDTKEAPPHPFRSRSRLQTQLDPIQQTNPISKKSDVVHPLVSNHQKHHPQQTRMISGDPGMSSTTNHLHKESPTLSQQSNQRIQESSTPANNVANNFYCSICDQTVSQNELSYIVIRVLACKPCSTSKVLILDEQAEGESVKNPSTSPQTNDCVVNKGKEREPSRVIEPDDMSRTRAPSTPREFQIGIPQRAGITISSARINTKTFEKESTRIL